MNRIYDNTKKTLIETTANTLVSNTGELSIAYKNWCSQYKSRLDYGGSQYNSVQANYNYYGVNGYSNSQEISGVTSFYASCESFLEKCKSNLETCYEEAHNAKASLSDNIGLVGDTMDIVTSRLDTYTSMLVDNSIPFSGDCELFKYILDRAELLYSNGLYEKLLAHYLEDKNWTELAKKPASELTEMEYMILAGVLKSLSSEEDIAEYMNYFMTETGSQDKFEHSGGHMDTSMLYECTYYEVDQEKVSRVFIYLQALVDADGLVLNTAYMSATWDDKNNQTDLTEFEQYLKDNEVYFENNYEDMCNEYNTALQKMGILGALLSLPTVSGSDVSPELTITYDTYKDSYVLGYKGQGSEPIEGMPTYSKTHNKVDFEIHINPVLISELQINDTQRNLENIYRQMYNTDYIGNQINATTKGFVTGKILSTTQEIATGMLGKKAVGYVPLIGDAVSVAIDIYNGFKGNQENIELANSIIEIVDESKLYSNFQVNVVKINATDPSVEAGSVCTLTPESIVVVNQYNDQIGAILQMDIERAAGEDKFEGFLSAYQEAIANEKDPDKKMDPNFRFDHIEPSDIFNNNKEMSFVIDYIFEHYPTDAAAMVEVIEIGD